MEKKKLIKKDVDEVIRLSKKYYSSHDVDYLGTLNAVEKKTFGNDDHWICGIIAGITCKSILDYNEPNETYYKVLEALGFEIVEE